MTGSPEPGFRSGFVAIVGRPNVGKSTLLNQILRSKVAITSDRPQTTRSAIRGILTTEEAQVVFVDTPGLHKPRTELGTSLNEVARGALADVDVVLFVVDASEGLGAGDAYVADALKRPPAPVVVALNKTDVAGDGPLRGQVDAVRALGPGWTVTTTSARTGSGVPELVRALVAHLPEGPMYYPAEVTSDQPERYRIAELVREKLLEATRDEVPHSIAVVVDAVETAGGKTVVDATVYVERESQKGIVIGSGGNVLKDAGTRARPEIERLVGSPVFLHLRVKVAKDWQRRTDLVRRFGYG